MQLVCIQGHTYTPVNTGRDKKGYRYCKTCKRLKGRARIDFNGFEYRSGFCKYGHEVRHNTYLRSDGSARCGICAVNTSRRRRDRKQLLDGSYSFVDEAYTRDVFRNMCFKCGSKNSLQIDHHYPLSKEFCLSRKNAVLLCLQCNASKNNRPPESFYTVDELKCLDSLLVTMDF